MIRIHVLAGGDFLATASGCKNHRLGRIPGMEAARKNGLTWSPDRTLSLLVAGPSCFLIPTWRSQCS